MNAFEVCGTILAIAFGVLCAYQTLYIVVSLISGRRRKKTHDRTNRRFAVLIAARNEEKVIGQLIDSVKSQDYPYGLIDVYVAADNCTDGTAAVSLSHGAKVFVRNDTSHIGKGYVLRFLLDKIKATGKWYDAFLVLDADNLLDSGYVKAMNEALSGGCDIVTGYRNSKNFGDNWISAGYSLWFLRESRLLNHARDILGTSAAVSGTGFAFTRELIERRGGWDCFLLTEDIQFTAESVLAGERIGYAPDAVLYDEQPTDLVQSFRQRRRWVRGSLQVFAKYGKQLLRGCPRDFACYDMIVNMLSGAVAGFAGMFMGVGAAVVRLCERDVIGAVVALTLPAVSGYIGLAALGAVTTMAEWKRIRCAAKKKIMYVFTFPLFMATYLPVCVSALFTGGGWEPVEHRVCVSVSDISGGDAA